MENKTVTAIVIVLLWALLAPRDTEGPDSVRLTACVGDSLTVEELGKFAGDWDWLDEDGDLMEGPPGRISQGKGSSVEMIEAPEPPPKTPAGRRRAKKDPPPPVAIEPDHYEVRKVGDAFLVYLSVPADPKQPAGPQTYEVNLIELQEGGNLIRCHWPVTRAFRQEIESGRLQGTVTANQKSDRAQVVVTSGAEDAGKAFTPEFLKSAFDPKPWLMFRRVAAPKP